MGGAAHILDADLRDSRHAAVRNPPPRAVHGSSSRDSLNETYTDDGMDESLSAMVDGLPLPLTLGGLSAQDGTMLVDAIIVHAASLDTASLELRRTTRRNLLAELRKGSEGSGQPELSPRDLCKVDPRFASRLPPRLHVRPDALLLSLGSLGVGAIILRDRLCLLASSRSTSLLCTVRGLLSRVGVAASEKRRRVIRSASRANSLAASPMKAATEDSPVRDGAAASTAADADATSVPAPTLQSLLGVPFELVCLEVLLTAACTELHARTTALAAEVRDELDELTSHGGIQLTVGTDWLGLVSELRGRVDGLQRQAQGLDEALTAVLEDDDILRAVCLSASRDEAGRGEGGRSPSEGSEGSGATRVVEAAELLLEVHVGHVRTAAAALSEAGNNIAAQERIALLMLDQVRNRLLKVDVGASSVSAAAGLGACIASIFGMNVPISMLGNVHDEDPDDPSHYYDTWLFWTLFSIILTIIIGFMILSARFLYFGPRGLSRRTADRDALSMSSPRRRKIKPRPQAPNEPLLSRHGSAAYSQSFASRSVSNRPTVGWGDCDGGGGGGGGGGGSGGGGGGAGGSECARAGWGGTERVQRPTLASGTGDANGDIRPPHPHSLRMQRRAQTMPNVLWDAATGTSHVLDRERRPSWAHELSEDLIEAPRWPSFSMLPRPSHAFGGAAPAVPATTEYSTVAPLNAAMVPAANADTMRTCDSSLDAMLGEGR
jgi:hypothetical protein